MYQAHKVVVLVARLSLQLQNKERQDVELSKCWSYRYSLWCMCKKKLISGQNIKNAIFLSLLRNSQNACLTRLGQK